MKWTFPLMLIYFVDAINFTAVLASYFYVTIFGFFETPAVLLIGSGK